MDGIQTHNKGQEAPLFQKRIFHHLLVHNLFLHQDHQPRDIGHLKVHQHQEKSILHQDFHHFLQGLEVMV